MSTCLYPAGEGTAQPGFGSWGQAGSPWGWRQMQSPAGPREVWPRGAESGALNLTIASLWGVAGSRPTELLCAAVWSGMWCLQEGPAASTLLLVSPSAPFPCCSILWAGFVQRLVSSLSKPGNPLPTRGPVPAPWTASQPLTPLTPLGDPRAPAMG